MEVLDISLEEPWKKKEFEEREERGEEEREEEEEEDEARNTEELTQNLTTSFCFTYLSSACGEEKIQANKINATETY